MSGSGLEALPEVREWLGGPPASLGGVWRPFTMSGSGRESLPKSGSGLEAYPKIGGGREAIPEVRECSGGPPGCQ